MILHRFANAILKVLMPLSAIRQAQAFGWDHDSWLADVEADHEVWEADELWQQTFDERSEEEWAAEWKKWSDQHRFAGGTTPPPPVNPTEGDMPASAVSFGGGFKSDEVLIEELVEDYRQFLRQCFGK